MTFDRMTVSADTRHAVVADCRRRQPDEACGMLVGRSVGDGTGGVGAVVEAAVPLDNIWPVVAERPTRYAVDPLRQMRAERDAEVAGLTVVGFYHSHPTGAAVPSEVDRSMAWPGYVYLIVGLSPAVECRAWRLTPGGEGFEEVTIL